MVGGLAANIGKTYMCMSRKLFEGAKNKGVRDVWEFQRFSSHGFCQVWLNGYLSVRINMH